MIRSMTIAMLAATLLLGGAGTASAQATSSSVASTEIDKAMDVLTKARIFEDVIVGAGGVRSDSVRAFRVIYASPKREELFTQLVQNGSTVGQLYGAIGLYGLDDTKFRWAVGVLKAKESERVETLSGCLIDYKTVGDLLEAKGAMRLQKGQTAADWLNKNGSGEFDIVGGGYTSHFAGTP